MARLIIIYFEVYSISFNFKPNIDGKVSVMGRTYIGVQKKHKNLILIVGDFRNFLKIVF